MNKFLEIRDRETMIPAVATLICSQGLPSFMLFRHAGNREDIIQLTKLDGSGSQSDPFDWNGSRTMQTAHVYIRDNFSKLEDGDVVDVEYILKETKEPKTSEVREFFQTIEVPDDPE